MPEPPKTVRIEHGSMRHAEAFVAAVRRSRQLHRSWVTPPATVEALRAYLRARRSQSNLTYFIFAGQPDALIGVMNISEIVRGLFQSAYLGYYAFAPHQRHGYMSQALAAVLELAFSEHGLHRLEANIQPANAASLALVRRAGFHREGFSKRYLKIAGRWRDHERWAITFEDWSRVSHAGSQLSTDPRRRSAAADSMDERRRSAAADSMDERRRSAAADSMDERRRSAAADSMDERRRSAAADSMDERRRSAAALETAAPIKRRAGRKPKGGHAESL